MTFKCPRCKAFNFDWRRVCWFCKAKTPWLPYAADRVGTPIQQPDAIADAPAEITESDTDAQHATGKITTG